MPRAQVQECASSGGQYRWLGGFVCSAVLLVRGPRSAAVAITVGAWAGSALAAGGNISTVAGTGFPGENGNGISAVSARVNMAQGVAVDGHGNPVIVDTNGDLLRVVARSATNPGYRLGGCAGSCTWTVGDIYVIAGNGHAGYADGVPALNAEIDSPTGVVVDHAGNPIFADNHNQSVRVLAVSAANPGYPANDWTVGDIYTIAGTGGAAGPPYTGDGVLATATDLHNPNGLALDTAGNLLIADSGNERVRVVAVSGTNPGYPLAGCGPMPCTWALDNIYTIAGIGSAAFSGDGQPATGSAVDPLAVASDAHNNVLIADQANNRVRVLAVSGSNPGYPAAGWTPGNLYVMAGTGIPSYTNDGQPAPGVELNQPAGIVVDAAGDPLVADTSNNRIRVIATATSNPGYLLAGCSGVCHWVPGDIYTVAGDGTPSYNGDNVPATKAQIHAPVGLGIDALHNLYIADSLNSRIRQVAVALGSAPGRPKRPTVSRSAAGTLKVKFTAPAGNGAPITRYTATCSSTNHGTKKAGSAKTSPVTVRGLTPGKTYTCTVTATNNFGTGPASPASSPLKA